MGNSDKYLCYDDVIAYLDNLTEKSGNSDMSFAIGWSAEHIRQMRTFGARQIYGWVPVREHLPQDGMLVWCAIYATDIVISEPGEDFPHAIKRSNLEAAKNPRVEIGYYSEEGWCSYDGWPMICKPKYWMSVDVPVPPKMEVEE